MKPGDFYLYFGEKDLQKVIEKFSTNDKQNLKKLMKNCILEQSKSLDLEISTEQEVKGANTLDHALKRSKLALNTLKIWNQIKQDGYSLKQLRDLLEGKQLELPENKTFYSEETIIEPSNPSNQNLQHQFKAVGKTITYKPKQIKQEDGTLRCKNCNKKFDMKAFDFQQLDDYRIHFETIHRKLTDREREELLEIYP